MDDKEYLYELQLTSNNTNKTIYAIYDDGTILFERSSGTLEKFGHIGVITPDK